MLVSTIQSFQAFSMLIIIISHCCKVSKSFLSISTRRNQFVNLRHYCSQQQRQYHSSLFVSLQQQQNYNNNSNMTDNGQQQQQQQQRPTIAKRVPISDLNSCGERLRQGDLVAFPTETVYGLGCNALNPSAITKVFQAKERPLTDPLIVHVNTIQSAFELWDDSNPHSKRVLELLCDQFWPGPLTLVAKAKSNVPSILMANTGFVACRSPSHYIARALIDTAQVPIAAPSANKFGHVSPTRATHVWNDLLYENVWIIDTELQDTSLPSQQQQQQQQNGTTSSTTTTTTTIASVCNVGVESTVAKVEMQSPTQGTVTLLRQGAVSVLDIQSCLKRHGMLHNDDDDDNDSSGNNYLSSPPPSPPCQFHVETNTKRATEEHVANVAPGQTIRHYAPHIPSFIISQSRIANSTKLSNSDYDILSKSVVIDFGGQLALWKSLVVSYRDLSVEKDAIQAAQLVFETLRWAETVSNASYILFPEIINNDHVLEHDDHDNNNYKNINNENHGAALELAVKDRLTRAASGVVIDQLEQVKVNK